MQKNRYIGGRRAYGAIALLSLSAATAGLSVLAPKVQAQEPQIRLVTLDELCAPLPESRQFQCYLEQSNRLNQAKNYARQRGEREHGGITAIEIEPSMHGPSNDSPHTIFVGDDTVGNDTVHYVFTFRIRPRGASFYTYQSQVAAIYNTQEAQWSFDTVYDREIEPTSLSYAETISGDR